MVKQAIRPAIFTWRQTEPELILCAVRWSLRDSLSFRDGEERLRERGLEADHTTIWCWVQHAGPELEERLRRHLKPTQRSWRVAALVRGCGQAYALQTVEPVTYRCGTRRVCQARSSGSERYTRARPHAVADGGGGSRSAGHSTWQEGVRLCEAAGAGTLAIFHHDLARGDEAMDVIAAAAERARPGTIVAREGLVLRY